jgi:2-polyprenyl-3-methyl-5-hydroxy-6-metoxy-1,4-benzoquinol methylase
MLIERTVPGLHDHLVSKISLPNKEARIIDLGCGSGAWLSRLKNLGYKNLYGADRDKAPMTVDGINFYPLNLDGNNLHGIEGLYDFIFAIEVIEHIGNISNLLEFVENRLLPGGYFFVSTPNVNSLATRLRHLWNSQLRHFDQFGDPTHITPIFIEPFIRQLKVHHLAVESIWTYPETQTQYGSRAISRWLTTLMRQMLDDKYPGDILCMMIRKDA